MVMACFWPRRIFSPVPVTVDPHECRSKANHVSYHLKALHGDAAALCESHYTDLAVFLAVLPDSSEASECI